MKIAITQRFDEKTHPGIDLCPFENNQAIMADIYSPELCRVIFAGWSNRGFGLTVKVITEDGKYMFFAHLNKIEVTEGDILVPGDIIGICGSSGKSSGIHLHFEVREGDNKTIINPMPWALKLF